MEKAIFMDIDRLVEVMGVTNDTDKDMKLFFEPRCEEITLNPNERVKILALAEPGALTVDVGYSDDGLQIYPRYGEATWYISKNGVVSSTMKLAFGIED